MRYKYGRPTSADTSRNQPTPADISRHFPADFHPTSADISRHPADIQPTSADIWMESADVGRKSAGKSRLMSATLPITLSLGSYFSFSSYQLLQFFWNSFITVLFSDPKIGYISIKLELKCFWEFPILIYQSYENNIEKVK